MLKREGYSQRQPQTASAECSAGQGRAGQGRHVDDACGWIGLDNHEPLGIRGIPVSSHQSSITSRPMGRMRGLCSWRHHRPAFDAFTYSTASLVAVERWVVCLFVRGRGRRGDETERQEKEGRADCGRTTGSGSPMRIGGSRGRLISPIEWKRLIRSFASFQSEIFFLQIILLIPL